MLNILNLSLNNNDYKSSINYHEQLNNIKNKVIPQKEHYKKFKIVYKLKQIHLIIYINKELEEIAKLDSKITLFNVLPLRNFISLCFITLDTPAIIKNI